MILKTCPCKSDMSDHMSTVVILFVLGWCFAGLSCFLTKFTRPSSRMAYTGSDCKVKSHDSRPTLSSKELQEWRIPKRLVNEYGMHGAGGNYGIAANIGNMFRIFDTYKTVDDANTAVQKLVKDDILTACDLYVINLDAWVPIPFAPTKETFVMFSDKNKNPFQQHLDSISADSASARSRCDSDSGHATTAYDEFAASISKLALQGITNAWDKLATAPNVEAALGILRRELGAHTGVLSHASIMQEFKQLRQKAVAAHSQTELDSKTVVTTTQKKATKVAKVICGEKERQLRDALL